MVLILLFETYLEYSLEHKLYITPLSPSTIMDGKISSYRGSHHTQHPNQMIIIVSDTDSKEKAEKMVGKK